MEAIDRKFKFTAESTEHHGIYDEFDSVLFLAKDILLLPTLEYYLELCSQRQVDERQIKGVQLLIERVEKFQKTNATKLPDIDNTDKGHNIIIPNEEL